jgi:hypothetical protein
MSQTRQTSGLTTSTSHYTSSRTSNSPSIKALQLEYAKLQKEPVEGFTVKLDDDSNLYKWHGKQKKKHYIKNFAFLISFFFSSSGNFWTTRYFI